MLFKHLPLFQPTLLFNKFSKGFILSSPNWLKDLTGAWLFYTVFPKLTRINPRFERIARFSPLIGVLIGVLQVSVLILLLQLQWPNESMPFIAIALGLWITGGIHVDGLMDTADGIAAGPSRCIEAMKDSRIGASGIIALTINLLLQIAALFKLRLLILFAIPIASFWGRYSQIWAISHYPYLNKEGSSKFLHKKNWRGFLIESIPSYAFLSFLIFILINIDISIISTPNLIIGIIVGFLPALIIPHLLARRLGGHSGDSYGASVVLVETCMLIIFSIILPAS